MMARSALQSLNGDRTEEEAFVAPVLLGNIAGGSALVAMLTTPRCTVRSRRPPAAAGAQPRRESPGELSTSAGSPRGNQSSAGSFTGRSRAP